MLALKVEKLMLTMMTGLSGIFAIFFVVLLISALSTDCTTSKIPCIALKGAIPANASMAFFSTCLCLVNFIGLHGINKNSPCLLILVKYFYDFLLMSGIFLLLNRPYLGCPIVVFCYFQHSILQHVIKYLETATSQQKMEVV